MAPKAVPLRSKCADSDVHGPPGHKSVMTTLTGFPEQDGFFVHFIYITVRNFVTFIKDKIKQLYIKQLLTKT